MNLMAFLNKGVNYANDEAQRRRIRTLEKLRGKWIDALTVDQTRAWMSLGEKQPEALNGLATMLILAGFAKVYDCKNTNIPDISVIRGAISTAQQCAQRAYVLDLATVQALGSATTRAIDILKECSPAAIQHASFSMADISKMLEAA